MQEIKNHLYGSGCCYLILLQEETRIIVINTIIIKV